MSLLQMSPFKRLLSGLAVVALAAGLAACSDEQKDAAADAPATAVNAAAETDAKPVVDATTTAATASSDARPSANGTGTQVAQAAVPAAKAELPEMQGEVDVAKLMEPGPLPEMSIGKADAPVTIVEYMSMTCPHCAAFHNETFDAIKTKYVDSGKVRFVVREFPFDPRAAAAFMLARCAPQGQYFPMVSMLFKQQQAWAAAPNGREALLQMSKLAGFTQESFEACLTNQKLLDDVQATMQKGEKDFGVKATPTFFLNGKQYSGDMSVDTMSGLIDGML